MEKIKALLLPLALVFAAIAVFEFGTRYGATNMRAYAIASEMQFPLQIYTQGRSTMDPNSRAFFEMIIDNSIAAGALHRQVWYLDKEAREQLEKVMAYALSVRGDAVLARFEQAEASEDLPNLNRDKLAEVKQAVQEAKVELVDRAPAPSPAQTLPGEEGP
jgi:menaquinone-dependent protoporphyrinogen IX oxidase